MFNMKSGREILAQRLENMQNGVETTEKHIESIKYQVSNILNLVKNDNSVDNLVNSITSDLDELRDFLIWLRSN